MGIEAVYRNTYTVGYSDVDFLKCLKCSKLFEYFQDTASEDVKRLGAGVDTLAEKYSVAWVLTRIRVEFARIPELNESITVATWPHPPGKMEFGRDFKVCGEDGDAIIRAVSTWVLIDTKTRELRRSDYIHMEHPEFIAEHALDTRPGKLRPLGKPEPVYRKVVGYSDVDFNGHINNSRYIDYIMDCFPVESHRQYMLKAIEVNYIKEAFPGDTLLLCREIPDDGDGTVYIEGVNEEDGKPCFKARIWVRPRQGAV
ncbi:MAG TPA: thioesterase [Clostridiales bacterium]|nr:thioesterase [Clostridiales bacterium]HPV01014.1 thioesterase [Clostridiales bacterium]